MAALLFCVGSRDCRNKSGLYPEIGMGKSSFAFNTTTSFTTQTVFFLGTWHWDMYTAFWIGRLAQVLSFCILSFPFYVYPPCYQGKRLISPPSTPCYPRFGFTQTPGCAMLCDDFVLKSQHCFWHLHFGGGWDCFTTGSNVMRNRGAIEV
jgi:hypothetical protein